jgi:hypothetical protein
MPEKVTVPLTAARIGIPPGAPKSRPSWKLGVFFGQLGEEGYPSFSSTQPNS